MGEDWVGKGLAERNARRQQAAVIQEQAPQLWRNLVAEIKRALQQYRDNSIEDSVDCSGDPVNCSMWVRKDVKTFPFINAPQSTKLNGIAINFDIASKVVTFEYEKPINEIAGGTLKIGTDSSGKTASFLSDKGSPISVPAAAREILERFLF